MLRRPLALLLASLITVSLSFSLTVSPSSAAGVSCEALRTDLHLLVHSRSPSSLTTVWPNEVRSATTKGFVDQGAIAKVSTSSGSGRVAVQRMTKGADFRYAQTSAQVAAAKKDGYQPSSVPFYAAATPESACPSAVYQVSKSGQHRLAAGTAARDDLVRQGWGGAEVLFYAPLPARAGGAPVDSGTQPVPSGPVAGPLGESSADKAFYFAVLPDTQTEMTSATDRRFGNRVDFLRAKQKTWDIRFALQVGDLVNWDTPDHAMYDRAARGLLPLEAKMPLVVTPGNHDTAAVCPGGSGCPGAKTWITVRDTKTFNTYLPSSRFGALRGQFEPGKVDNAYHTLRAGGVDWLILNLELWPRPSAIAWANQVVKANPKKNVIVMTHSYLTKSGQISGSNGGYGATSPQYLYDHLIKLYPNIKMVMSGHTGTSAIRTDKGVAGNTIVSMLQCFHSKDTNPVRLVSVHTDSNNVYTNVMSPSKSTSKAEYAAKITGLKFVR